MNTNPMNLRLAGSLLLALLALALLPSLAAADSIVYVKDGNVWLTAPDGSRQTAVTTDGTAELPYLTPSQADNGTIAAARGTKIVLLQQNGEVIRELDPPPLVDSTSHTIDGVPVFVAISPDATKVAYSFVGYGCPVWTECMARATSGVTDATQVVPASRYGQVTYGNPQWVSPNRLMVFGGFLHQVNLWDLGQPDAFHWFDDKDWAGSENSTDLGDGDLSRDGRIWAGIRGYDDAGSGRFRQLIWFKTSGNPSADAPPPVPEDLCISDPAAGTSSPTIAPGGDTLAFERLDGIWLVRGVTTDQSRCTEAQEVPLIPGGSEPDWGPADVNPQPRGSQPPAQTPPQTVPGKKGTPARGGAGLRVTKAGLRGACSRGLQVRLSSAPAGRTTIVVRRGNSTVARTVVRVPASGKGSYMVRFSKRGTKQICVPMPRKVTLRVSAAGLEQKLVLKR
jgi:hypothetical protein